ncbi:hypothetical protein P170DRAFT_435805 [Aspergillus steynii IBT 23096]|uniref:RING-type domain-containing protein n=1 Tax=Aspergillus steynii IBT 23096 TaxID=1392250 RepID=A0A2I2GCL0_9EURO|nr:uncharacterized protein P170DRAFT_435805 [Aspergillus steynii IBT 23096]PLB50619.1 hypothetical protein P170DRAFT_435805 [Aspergillus steynii IBT 23096]
MVLSLPVPSFRSSTTSPPLPAGDNHQSATITEALRNNPFGITLRSRSATAATASPAPDKTQDQKELNDALETLARIFPDVKIEVFRELLVRFDGLSRLQVCVEQLLRHKEEWVAGRWNVPTASAGSGDDAVVPSPLDAGGEEGGVPRNELFRTDEYKASVKSALSKEFSSLSKSAVDAVLAEVNFCYIRARPTLRDLASKTWRATFNSMFPFKNKKDKQDHPLVLWKRQPDGELGPILKDTGCGELNRELHEALVAPMLRTRREEREARDLSLAEKLNELEATAANAIYECECCLMEVTFERISTCSDNSHVICYGCIQRTVQEAVFGQGWSKSVDVGRATLKCIAPFGHEACHGNLNSEIVKRAVFLDKAGSETYLKFEGRLASEALLKSQLKLIRCPCCSYAEVDSAYHCPPEGIKWHFRRQNVGDTIILILILLDLIPLLLIPVLVLFLIDPALVPMILRNAVLSLCLKARRKTFNCSNPACRRISCIDCQKPWRDPHVCHEPLLLDLRATVEAARTAAVKRTCPRCGLSFVKSSGCNKLTCVCGYSMCYLCRKGLSPPLNAADRRGRARRRREGGMFNQENIFPVGRALPMLEAENEEPDSDEDESEILEGYRHFCEHFRLTPGSRCSECTKCELYQDVDEEAVARRAGEKAEREWNMRQGTSEAGVGALHVNNDFSMIEGKGRGRKLHGKGCSYWLNEVWLEGRWKTEGQAFVNWLVEQTIVIEDI